LGGVYGCLFCFIWACADFWALVGVKLFKANNGEIWPLQGHCSVFGADIGVILFVV